MNPFILTLILLLAASCRTSTVSQSRQSDTNRTAILTDTMLIRDTVQVSQTVRQGAERDTVFIDRYRTRTVIRTVTAHDTLTVAVRDTVAVPITAKATPSRTEDRSIDILILLALILLIIAWKRKK